MSNRIKEYRVELTGTIYAETEYDAYAIAKEYTKGSSELHFWKLNVEEKKQYMVKKI
jgi:hypothetical protein